MSIEHSVENRIPYLDNEMVQLAWDILEIFLLDRASKEGKYILKDIALGIFGNEFAFRRKVGFFIPGNMFLCSETERLEEPNEICYMGMWSFRETSDPYAGRNSESCRNCG